MSEEVFALSRVQFAIQKARDLALVIEAITSHRHTLYNPTKSSLTVAAAFAIARGRDSNAKQPYRLNSSILRQSLHTTALRRTSKAQLFAISAIIPAQLFE